MDPPIIPETPSATRIAEMRAVDNSANPMVFPVGKITSSWTGHVLEKDNGKYAEWAYAMKLELLLAQLWDYVFDPMPSPDATYKPQAYCLWTSNCHLACSFLKCALSSSKQKLCAEEEDPGALWIYLKDCHGGAVPVKQVQLLQEALTAKCSLSELLTKMVDVIFKKIDCAFNAVEVTKDLLKSIAMLSALLDKSFAHIQSIISQDLRQASNISKYGPTEIRLFLEGEQTLLEADKSPSIPIDSALAAAPGKASQSKDITCMACKACQHPAHIYTGHTVPWCILEGGGMAGKSIKESKKARLAFYDGKWKEREKRDKAVSKMTFTPAGGSIFTLEGNPATIAAYLAMQAPKTATTDAPKAEFTGLGYNTLPAVGFLADVEGLEFDAWIVLEEEHGSQCRIGPEMDRDWYKANNTSEEDHELISLSQNQTLEPFYLDSGATTHISPNQGDFIKLDLIPTRQIHGVGGTSIAAIGVGTIRRLDAEHSSLS
ncbi:Copia protein [Termitomyces sp. T112]|nr:Copia protein [Termitomyces sp. T112]